MDIFVFDSDKSRIEKLQWVFEKTHNLVVCADFEDFTKSATEKAIAVFIDNDLDPQLRDKIFEFASKNDLQIFSWLRIGEKLPINITNLPIHFLPTPPEKEDLKERIEKAFDTPKKIHIIVATPDEDFASYAEPLFRLQGWDVTRVADAVSLRKILDSSSVSLLWADIRLVGRLFKERFERSPRIPLIIFYPDNSPFSGTYIIDNTITIQVSEVSKKALIDIVENACSRGERAVLREASFFMSLDNAERNSQLMQRLLDIQMKSAKESSINRREEELNLLNAQTMGLVGEFFSLLRDVLDRAKLLSRIVEKEKIQADIFDLNSKIANAQEILDSLSSVVWYKDTGSVEEVDLQKIVGNSASKVKANRRRREIEWFLDLKKLEKTVGKKAEMSEAFIEIITNAYEAIEGSGTVSIKGRQEGNWNIIEISDDGVGMDADTLSKAHRPYFSNKSATHVGLGLTIAKGIIEFHGGSVAVKSKKGAGTKVTIKLPKSAFSPTESVKRQPDILIIAHRKTLGFLQASLVHYGLNVSVSESIGEAIQSIKKDSPKAILALASADFIDVDSIRLLANIKKSSKLVLLDPAQRIPRDTKGLDASIQGGLPLHHLLAIIKAFIE